MQITQTEGCGAEIASIEFLASHYRQVQVLDQALAFAAAGRLPGQPHAEDLLVGNQLGSLSFRPRLSSSPTRRLGSW